MNWLLFYFSFLLYLLKRSREQKQWPRQKTSRGAGDLGEQVDYWGCSPGAVPPAF